MGNTKAADGNDDDDDVISPLYLYNIRDSGGGNQCGLASGSLRLNN